jgi:prolyl oligopeptidase
MQTGKFIPLVMMMTFTTVGCSTTGQQKAPTEYPSAPTDSTVVDNYFGISVRDIYRPLENDTAAATLAWVKAENAVTDAYMNGIPFLGKLRSRMAQIVNYKATSLPSLEKDGKYYYFENDGSQNQSVLYVKDTLTGEGRVLLDPNKLSKDGTVALSDINFDPAMRYMAYIINRNGSDWAEIYVMDLKTGKLLSDHIEWCKFTSAAWHGDGFYYSAYDKPADGKEFSNTNECQRVYYHKLGTKQADDKLVYEDTAHPLYFHSVLVDEDQTALMLYIAGDGVGNGMKIKDLRKPNADWVTMEASQDETISVFDVQGDTLYIETSWGAPRTRIMVADINHPQRENWKELVPEQEGVLVGAQRAADKFIFTYEKDAVNHAYLYETNGKLIREIELPGPGTVSFSTSENSTEVRYAFISFICPSSHYTYDMATGKSTLFHQTEIDGFNSDDYVTEQVFYPSADGTKIPMFITHKKGIKLDGNNPTLLYGYGGFSVSLNPGFSPYRLAWLEAGGIYCSANLRGGAEYGEEWHKAGTKMNKLNVFNDFIAAAEYLIKSKYTNPQKLAIMGGSNGGLLIGATVNMRPELFKVAIPQVGVMDMMRYHKFTIGWNWASDYGTSDDSAEMAKYLLGYSPLHNIKNDGTPYPAILVSTADHDDRVVPAHSFKYAATLQASNTGDAPKLIRIDANAGHGAGKPLDKKLDEYAETYSFIFYNMGIDPTK